MSSAVVSTSAAWGRHFVFENEPEGDFPAKEQFQHVVQSTIKNQQSTIPLIPASRLGIRPAPAMVPSGIPALDELTGGLPRGCLTEICGAASSGGTTLLLAALAAATRRGEYCALVDACDALDPQSAVAAGVDLERLLWVRCGEELPPTANSPRRHRDTEKKNLEMKNPWRYSNPSEHRLEQVLRATDLLLESGGFGMIALDLADLPPQMARRIPLTTWFRFRRAIEHTPTILLAVEQQAIAGSCSSLLLQLGSPRTPGAPGKSTHSESSDSSREAAVEESPARECRGSREEENESRRDDTNLAVPQGLPPTHAQLLTGLNIEAELIRSRLERKPARSVSAFASKTAWAG